MFNELKVFTDGGSRHNPGDAAIGIVIYNDQQMLWQRGEYIGQMTNNEAEYFAVKSALEWLLDYFSQSSERCQACQIINFFLDSKLVVCQINGEWKIKDIKMQSLCSQCHQLLENLPVKCSFNHIPREKNQAADALVNQALDLYQENLKNQLK